MNSPKIAEHHQHWIVIPLMSPVSGLHPKDIQNITTIIQQIRDKRNTVLIVEHDPDLIRIADWVIDMGPGSQKNGDKIIFEGTFEALKNSNGKTGSYFSKQPGINQKPKAPKGFIEVKNANLHNLKNITVNILKGVLTIITGVAGSGKGAVNTIDQSLFSANARWNDSV